MKKETTQIFAVGSKPTKKEDFNLRLWGGYLVRVLKAGAAALKYASVENFFDEVMQQKLQKIVIKK